MADELDRYRDATVALADELESIERLLDAGERVSPEDVARLRESREAFTASRPPEHDPRRDR